MMKTTPTQERVGGVGQRRQVVIPREILETLNLRAGERAVPSDDTLSPEEAKIVRRGEAHLKRDESKSWRAVKPALPR
jgi:bifunctional DNA-binding transcriptional regulator/antitoxin component of YhaV-PrlF toxin-antitoxin module